MKTPAFGYYMHDGRAAFSIELAGALAAEGAKKLEQDWRSASAVACLRRSGRLEEQTRRIAGIS